jgi:NTP pyrophosphatase (non-canonical NTP hydrolase)
MKKFDYQKECLRTEPDDKEYQKILDNLTVKDLRLIHAALGMVTEVGEVVDIIKKNLFYGKPLDIEHLKEELADMSWYKAIPANIFDFTFEEIQKANIEKLKKRYPEKFTRERALKRD